MRRYRRLIDETAAIVGTTPQTISSQPALGQLDGQPWIRAIFADHTEPDSLASLARLLQDACYIAGLPLRLQTARSSTCSEDA